MKNIKHIPNSEYLIDTETLKFYKRTNNGIKEDLTLLRVDDKVIITIDGEPALNTPEWFKHIANLKLKLPHEICNQINNIVFHDYEPHGIAKDYEKLPIFKKPVLILGRYRVIARFPQYAVSTDAELINYTRNTKVNISKSTKYSNVIIADNFKENGVRATGLHRLVGMAWVDGGEEFKYNVIDHKDDNPRNNNYTNLQWTNNSGNMTKRRFGNAAYNFITRNIYTGAIAKHRSLTDACRHIGRSRINTVDTPIVQGKIWRGENGKFELLNLDTFTKWTHDVSIQKEKKVKLEIDGETLYFTTVKELRKYVEIKHRQATNVREIERVYLLKHNKPIKITVLVGSKDNRYVEARDVTTGKVYGAKNPSALSDLIGVSRSTLSKYIKVGNESKAIDGKYQVRVKSTLPWEEPKFDVNIEVKKISTGEVKYFSSVRQVAMYLNVDDNTVNKYLDSDLEWRDVLIRSVI